MGVVRSLVARPVFKTGGGRIPSLVSSILIYSRHFQQTGASHQAGPCLYEEKIRIVVKNMRSVAEKRPMPLTNSNGNCSVLIVIKVADGNLKSLYPERKVSTGQAF